MENSIENPLPQEAVELLNAFIDGLYEILGDNLYGVYMYGASVFPDSGPLRDIDCHVIIREKLTETERAALRAQYQALADQFPSWGEELDAYTILLEDAKGPEIPQHQVLLEIYDHSWALHCAHIRAGYYRTLWGSEPDDIFPTPTWETVDAALNHELQYVLDHPKYPAYGILNLCRILYSFATRDPAVSKLFSSRWGAKRFPQWTHLIQAAMRYYRNEHSQIDLSLIATQRDDFYSFMKSQIEEK